MKVYILDNDGEITKEIEITEDKFAYDGCHKIYMLNNDKEAEEAKKFGYSILPIEDLEKTFINSCELRFIQTWDLKKTYIDQFEVDNIGNLYFQNKMVRISWYNKNGSLLNRVDVKNPSQLDYKFMQFAKSIQFELEIGDKICIDGIDN